MKKAILAVLVALVIVAMAATPVLAAPKGTNNANSTNVFLFPKDTTTWEYITDGAWAKVEYVLDGTEISCTLKAHDLEPGATYKLISYNDPWGSNPQSVVILSGTADKNGKLFTETEEAQDIGDPSTTDLGTGYKIWLVPDDAVDNDGSFNGWDGDAYLYEGNIISAPED